MRPQAHDIIRTWALYTIVQSCYHEGRVPWDNIMISGWGLAPAGSGKISKSKGGGPIAPMAALERYSADALRYWAASTALGKDAVISEDKIAAGAKLVTKLWNVASFSRRFLEGYRPEGARSLTPADRWILSEVQHVTLRGTRALDALDYMGAKNEVEVFFWRDLADNYLEMAKRRLYDSDGPGHAAAQFTLYHVLLTTLKLFAPILPFVTDRIYRGLFADIEGAASIHRSHWPDVRQDLIDAEAEQLGRALVAIAGAVRHHKSERKLSLGAELPWIELTGPTEAIARLGEAADDLMSVTRAREIRLVPDASTHRGAEGRAYDVRIAVATGEE